jgi:hypothetical protein
MEVTMRSSMKALLALGLVVGAASFTIPTADMAMAQGYYGPPTVYVGPGGWHRREHRRWHRGYGAFAADPGHPYGYNYDYGDPRCGIPNYTIQGGVCKPYTGR